MRRSVPILVFLLLGGCTRAFWHRNADNETYPIIAQKANDGHLGLPSISVDPPPESRLHDPFDSDYPPLPPDDPAAQQYMHRADGHRGYRGWHKDGDAPWVEDLSWFSLIWKIAPIELASKG